MGCKHIEGVGIQSKLLRIARPHHDTVAVTSADTTYIDTVSVRHPVHILFHPGGLAGMVTIYQWLERLMQLSDLVVRCAWTVVTNVWITETVEGFPQTSYLVLLTFTLASHDPLIRFSKNDWWVKFLVRYLPLEFETLQNSLIRQSIVFDVNKQFLDSRFLCVVQRERTFLFEQSIEFFDLENSLLIYTETVTVKISNGFSQIKMKCPPQAKNLPLSALNKTFLSLFLMLFWTARSSTNSFKRRLWRVWSGSA